MNVGTIKPVSFFKAEKKIRYIIEELKIVESESERKNAKEFGYLQYFYLIEEIEIK